MSFFGIPQPHDERRPGFGPTQDAFANLKGKYDDDDGGIDFDDTYDGLADQLEEDHDDLNDETFGADTGAVGKDFDFFGNTANVADVINEEHMIYGRKVAQQTKPTVPTLAPSTETRSTGPQYSQQTKPQHELPHIKELKPDMSLWTTGPAVTTATASKPKRNPYLPPPPPPEPAPRPPGRKALTLEEVEAQLLGGSSPAVSQQQQSQQQIPQHQSISHQQAFQQQIPSHLQQQQQYYQQIPQQQQQFYQQQIPNAKQLLPFQSGIAPSTQQGPVGFMGSLPHQQQQQQQQLLQDRRQMYSPVPQQQVPPVMHRQSPPHPQIPQTIPVNPNLPATRFETQPPSQPGIPLGLVQNGAQEAQRLMAQLSVGDKVDQTKLMQEEAKRLKRNHKIAQLAPYNGLMTPQDKNWITRIQLQQLVSVNDDFNEDFYFQVHSAIQARNNPQQPLNQFAQTYLFQQGQSQKGASRNRRTDNHMARMEQQVARAVAAAKARPKTSQLVLEGSLGKISFSNVKAPRPMLNLKQSGEIPVRKASVFSGADKKSLLKQIEAVYDCLLDLEMHERTPPPPLAPGQPPELVHIEYGQKQEELFGKLWAAMKILAPIDPSTTHPFIAMLSYAKGKKAIPRIFRYTNNEQRVTILTMITVHLDVLDVVKNGAYHPQETQLPAAVREEIELFTQTVFPPLLSYVAEAPLNIVIGLLGILLERVDVTLVSRTKIGLQFLTMFVSRAEIIKQTNAADPNELAQWAQMYDRLFAALEPHFAECFPPAANFVDDMYVWQFLASIAVGASNTQHQLERLVDAVKDRVMENFLAIKTLPPDLAAQKSANVNLFMRAIGLDVELLNN